MDFLIKFYTRAKYPKIADTFSAEIFFIFTVKEKNNRV